MAGLATNPVVRERFTAGNTRLKELYPAAVCRPVTLLVGRFSTGGTTGNSGLLIGSEFYSIDSTTPLDELGSFQQANVHAAGGLHGSAGTLLEQTISEGSADFLGELVGKIYAWGFRKKPRSGGSSRLR